jgi:hypothetical protein
VPHKVGQAYAYMALTAIVPGRSGELREHLEALPLGADSPLAKLENVHFGRWLIIPHLVYQGPPQEPGDELKNEYLMFSADFDGELEPFLDAVATKMSAEADAIWSHCVGYPGTSDAEAFKRYMRHNQIPTSMPVGAYAEHPLPEVREALALRARLIDLAVRAQTLDADALREAYRRELAR